MPAFQLFFPAARLRTAHLIIFILVGLSCLCRQVKADERNDASRLLLRRREGILNTPKAETKESDRTWGGQDYTTPAEATSSVVTSTSKARQGVRSAKVTNGLDEIRIWGETDTRQDEDGDLVDTTVNADESALDPTNLDEGIVEKECSQSVSSLSNKTVSLEFPGNWSWLMSEVTTADQDTSWTSAAETVFVKTYNSLSFSRCDFPYFRRVLSGILVLPEEGAIKDEEGAETINSNVPLFPQYNETTNTTTLTVIVEAECRSCNESFSLFDITTSATDTIDSGADLTPSASITIARQENINNGDDESDSQLVAVCRCTESVPEGDYRAPTLKEFQDAFHEQALAFLPEEPPAADDILVEEVPCSSNVTNFTSFVYVDVLVEGSEPLSALEKATLEASFANTYNQLAFLSCDSFFRSVLEVNFQLGSDTDDENIITDVKNEARRWERYLQQEGQDGALDLSQTLMSDMNQTLYDKTNATDSNSTGAGVNATVTSTKGGSVFAITGQCRGCQVTASGSFSLFDDVFRRVLTEEKVRATSKTGLFHFMKRNNDANNHVLGRWLEENVTQCVCPQEANFEQLSKDMFVTSYNQKIQELQESGAIESVQGVSDLQEGQEVACSGEVQMFTSTVYADVNLQEIGPERKALLEDLFMTSYNDLAFSSCDGLFRSVVDVSLETEVNVGALRRFLQENAGAFLNYTNSTNTSSWLNTTIANPTIPPLPSRESASIFSITGTCRDCPVTSSGSFSLFDAAFRRRRALKSVKPEKGFSAIRGLLGRVDGSCVCPTGSEPNDEGMSAGDFKQVLNDEIAEQKEAGLLEETVEVVVDNVLEGQVVDCGSNISDFTSEIFSDLAVNITSLTTEEVRVLEEAFLRTYNNLAFDSCDGYFRKYKNCAGLLFFFLSLFSRSAECTCLCLRRYCGRATQYWTAQPDIWA